MPIALILIAAGFIFYFTRPECELRGNTCEPATVEHVEAVKE